MIPPKRVRTSRRRGRELRVERLEARDLPTFTIIHHGVNFSPAVLSAIMAADAARSSRTPAPAPPGLGTPTAHEFVRQSYVGKFLGTYTAGPGRFSGQSGQIYTSGSGTSTQALHGQYQMRISLPADPNASIGGVIAIFPTNVATTGSTLILELTADPASKVRGMPTHFTWSVSPSSGGAYTNAGGYGTGAGTLDIRYLTGGHGAGSVLSAGRAAVVIRGLIDVGGVFNDLGVPGNVPSHP